MADKRTYDYRWFRADVGYEGAGGLNIDAISKAVEKVLANFVSKSGTDKGMIVGEKSVNVIPSTGNTQAIQTFAVQIKKNMEDRITTALEEAFKQDPVLKGASGAKIFNAGVVKASHPELGGLLSEPQAQALLARSLKNTNAALVTQPDGVVTLDVLGTSPQRGPGAAKINSIIRPASQLNDRLQEEALAKIRTNIFNKAEKDAAAMNKQISSDTEAKRKQKDDLELHRRAALDENVQDKYDFINAQIGDAHRKDDDKKKAKEKQEEEKEKHRKQVFSGVTRALTVLTALTASILHVVNKLFGITVENAKEAVANSRTAHNLGMDPLALRNYKYLAKSKGLDENIFTNVFSDMQSRFGNIIDLNPENMPGSFQAVMGENLATLFKGGISGDNSEKFVQTILDKYMARYRSGVSSTGIPMDPSALRSELFTSLSHFSPELAEIFGSMLEMNSAGNITFDEYKKSLPSNIGPNRVDLDAFTRLGNEINELSVVLEQFKDKFSANFITNVGELAATLDGILRWLNKDTRTEDEQKAIEANRKTLAVAQGEKASYENAANAYLAQGVKFGKFGPVVHSIEELKDAYPNWALHGVDAVGSSVLGPELQAALAGYAYAEAKEVELKRAIEKGNPKKVRYDDYDKLQRIHENIERGNLKYLDALGFSFEDTSELEKFALTAPILLPTEALSKRKPELWKKMKAAGANEKGSKQAQLGFAKKLKAGTITGEVDYSDYADFLYYAGLTDAMVQGKASAASAEEVESDYRSLMSFDKYRDTEAYLKEKYPDVWKAKGGKGTWEEALWGTPFGAGVNDEYLQKLIDVLATPKDVATVNNNIYLDGELIGTVSNKVGGHSSADTETWINQITDNGATQQ